jgi:hypothetical protein
MSTTRQLIPAANLGGRCPTNHAETWVVQANGEGFRTDPLENFFIARAASTGTLDHLQ